MYLLRVFDAHVDTNFNFMSLFALYHTWFSRHFLSSVSSCSFAVAASLFPFFYERLPAGPETDAQG